MINRKRKNQKFHFSYYIDFQNIETKQNKTNETKKQKTITWMVSARNFEKEFINYKV